MPTDEQIDAHIRRFVEVKAAAYSPTYAALGRAVGKHAALRALLPRAAGGPPMDVLLACVQWLVRRDAVEALLPLFDSGVADTGELERAVDNFVLFACDQWDRLAEAIGRARLQTNEPGRSVALMLGLRAAAETLGATSIDLIELGASAGLLLAFDRYSYALDLVDSDRREFRAPVVDTGLTATVSTTVYGWPDGFALPSDVPDVPRRVGIDLNPIDVTNAEDRLWLESHIWPEEGMRRTLLRDAMAVCAQEPPPLRRGDAAAELPGLLEEAADRPVCVFMSHAVGQFPREVVEAVELALRPRLASGTCVRITLEGNPGGPLPMPRRTSGSGTYALLSVEGPAAIRSVALAGSHGSWVEQVEMARR